MRKKNVIIPAMFVLFLMLILVVLWAVRENTQEQPDLLEAQDNHMDSETEQTEIAVEVSEEDTASEEAAMSEEDKLDARIKEILSSMTLEEKVAQLFVVTPESLVATNPVIEADEFVEAALEEYPVGGVVFFSKNLLDTEQTTQMLNDMQQSYKSKQGIQLFLAVDEEGGRVRRIGKNENFHVEDVEAMGTLAQAEDTEIIFNAADTIGAYLSELGFNVDFAPDADVITNENNEVIGDRSFGTDPELVSRMAASYSDGLHNNGVLSCYKHYPGHGGTVEDSHTGAAYSYKTIEELYEAELVPFMNAESSGADFVMVAHICLPEVTKEENETTDIPATFSKRLVTDILRNEMGYQGIIITDSLSMGAIIDYYDENEVAVYALEAGCDMLLMPKDFKGAYEAVLTALQENVLTKERLDESIYRIIKKKLLLESESMTE